MGRHRAPAPTFRAQGQLDLLQGVRGPFQNLVQQTVMQEDILALVGEERMSAC